MSNLANARTALHAQRSPLHQIWDLGEQGITLLDNLDSEFREPFLYVMFQWMEKIPTVEIPTAAVAYLQRRNVYVFLYNPYFMAKLGWTSKEDPTLCREGMRRQKAVILHEMFHVHGRHLTIRNLEGIFSPHFQNREIENEAKNHAMDLAINSVLSLQETLPIGLFPGGITDPTEEDLKANRYAGFPEKLSAEAYAHLMVTDPAVLKAFQNRDMTMTSVKKTLEELVGSPGAQGTPQPGPQGDSRGPYEGFDRVSDVFDDSHVESQGDEIAESNLYDRMLREAVRQRQWGSVPSQMQEDILERLRVKPVHWKQILRELTGRTVKCYHHTTFQKLNRKYPWLHPGRKSSHSAKILVAVDQSGSVDNDLLSKIFAAFEQLSHTVSFYLCPFTSDIDPKDVKKITRNMRLEFKRELTGGTDFQAPTDLANLGGYDALIIATDMECYRPGPCRVPRWWLTDPRGKETADASGVAVGERVIVVD